MSEIDFERLARAAFDSFLLALGFPHVEYRLEGDAFVGPWHELDERVRRAWTEALREGASHAGRRIARDHVWRLMDENAHLRARPLRDHEQAAVFALSTYEDALSNGRLDWEPALVAGEMAKVLTSAEAITAEQRDLGASEVAKLRAELAERTWERDGLVSLATRLGGSEGQLARVVEDRIEVRRIQDDIGSLEARETIVELRTEVERLKFEHAEYLVSLRVALGDGEADSDADEIVGWIARMTREHTAETEARERLEAALRVARTGIDAVESLISESEGVYGLHRNGDPSPWRELRRGGQFDAWLGAFEDALDAATVADTTEAPCEPS